MYTKVPSLKEKLEQQISALRTRLGEVLTRDAQYFGFLLTGSCARSDATYRSDIDVLVILDEGELKAERVARLRENLESSMQPGVLEVQFTFILKTSLNTSEPGLKQALHESALLAERNGLLSKFIATKVFAA